MVKSAKNYPKANEVLPAIRIDGYGPWRIVLACGRDVSPHTGVQSSTTGLTVGFHGAISSAG
jgi:hypothetical protein